MDQYQGLSSIGFFNKIGQKLLFADFYLRRAFRILPAYWAVLLLYLLVPSFRESPGIEPWWKFFTFSMNLSIDYTRNTAFSHAWSLCIEEHFYWLFPLAVVAMFRRPASWKFALLCAGVVLGGIALRAAIWTYDMNAESSLVRNWFIEDIYYPTWNRLDGLLCGVALAAWKTLRPQSWLSARRYANLGLLAGVFLLTLSFQLFRNRVGLLGNTIGWPVLSCALGLFVFAGAGRDSLIGRREFPLAGWLAAISYSLYLVHKAVYRLVQEHWAVQWSDGGLFAFVVYGGAALLVGAALHYSVERPFLRLRQRLGSVGTQPLVATRL